MNLANWIFYSLFAFIIGVFLRSFWETSWIFFINLALISSAIVILSWLGDQKWLKIFGLFSILSIFISLGIIRTGSFIFAKDELGNLRDSEETVSITGIVKGEPDLREDHVKYTVLSKPQNENILVSAALSSVFYPGDKILIEGTLQTPAEFPDFNYKEFLLKDKIRTVSYYPEIELIEKSRFGVLGTILKIKDELRIANKKIIPFPESELLGAMLLGDKQLLPETLKESFNKTGIRHITAISGMHITIVASLLMAFFAYGTKLGKNRAFYLVLFSLIFYIALVGFPPSAVRAGIMASIVLLAEKVRRKYFAPRALVLAGAGMLIWNPLFLRFDVGFQLSFLAVLGIIYISPFFNLIFEKIIKGRKLEWLKKVIAMTLGAQISTLPILIYNFGLFSGSAPIVNVLIVPLLPFVIGLGFLGILAGTISQILGMFLSFPAYLLLSYVIWISKIFENFKISNIKIENMHYSLIILYYFILTVSVVLLRRKFVAKTEPLIDNLPERKTEDDTK